MKESSFNGISKLSFIENHIPDLNESKLKTYLHFPSRPCSDKKLKLFTEKMQCEFAPLFSVAYLIGITFVPPVDETGSQVPRPKNLFKTCYTIGINLLCFASLVLTLAFEHNFAISKAMTFTYFIKYIAGFLIRCNLVFGSCKIPQIIKTLFQLYDEFSPTTYKSLKIKIYLESLFAFSISLALIGVATARILIEAEVHNLPVLTILGQNVTADGDISLTHILVAAHTLNYFFSVFTMSICILTCCNVHIILSRLITNYGKCLVDSIQRKTTKEGFTDDFVTFRRIMFGVSAADEVLSFITLFSYVACISCFFYTVSSFFAIDSISSRPYFTAEMVFIFVFSVIIFSFITYTGIQVFAAGENLKNRVICVSEIILKKNLPCETLLSFMILFDNIKCSSTGMSGWGMFVINRGFVLSTVGVMITYGVLLFQFG